jgi:hypothetical protein
MPGGRLGLPLYQSCQASHDSQSSMTIDRLVRTRDHGTTAAVDIRAGQGQPGCINLASWHVL